MNELSFFVMSERLAKKLTQEEMASQIGIPLISYKKIEKGKKVNFAILRKLGFYFKKPKIEIYRMQEDKKIWI